MYIHRGLLLIAAMTYTTFPVKAKIYMVLLHNFNIPYTIKKYNICLNVIEIVSTNFQDNMKVKIF